MTRVLALVAAAALDGPDTTEFLRALAALRAVGVPVTLVEIGAAVGRLSDPDTDALSADGERFLAALREDGVEVAGPGALPDALAAAAAILTLGDPARSGTPGLMTWPRGSRPSADDVAALRAAGQVVIS